VKLLGADPRENDKF